MKTSNKPQIRIAIQGYAGSYHEQAAHTYFGMEGRVQPHDSFANLFRAINSGLADFAVVAIENTVAGTILPNYSLLRTSPVQIIGEVYLHISHCLMSLPGQQIEELTSVHSHPMALLQCTNFLGKYPHLKLVEADDTAGAASRLQPRQAAIASRRAAQLAGLEILASPIEDDPQNFTRFLIIQPESAPKPSALVNKVTLCFNLNHAVGSLAQVLLVLSSHGLNLTKIQSLPVPGRSWEYFFHIDLEFNAYDQYRRGTAAIDHLVDELHILGEYPKGEQPRITPPLSSQIAQSTQTPTP